jgi:hypothetical protein
MGEADRCYARERGEEVAACILDLVEISVHSAASVLLSIRYCSRFIDHNHNDRDVKLYSESSC